MKPSAAANAWTLRGAGEKLRNSGFGGAFGTNNSFCSGHGSSGSRIDYSLNRWAALTRYLDDGQVPIDNNWIGSRIRPVAQGRVNWLFAGSLRSGRRLVAIMGLNQSATFAGHDAHAYLKDVLAPLPNYPASGLGALLPRRRQRVSSAP